MAKSGAKVYFPNLDGLRFIAALLVIIHHVEMTKKEMHLPNVFGSGVDSSYVPGTVEAFVHVIGKLGVVLFFALSGFLITYLLMTEKARTGTIAIKKFYLRRVMRIWPLYFLIVFFSLFAAPHIDFLSIPDYPKAHVLQHLWLKAFLFIFFLPNLLMVGLGVIPFAGQTWSIGTEEQFYLMWPWVMRKYHHRIRILLTIIGIYAAVYIALNLDLSQNYFYQLAKRFWGVFNIDIMAIGGIGAVLVFEKRKRALDFLYARATQYITLAIVLILIALGVHFPWFHFEIYGLLFTILIVNLATNPRSIINLEQRPVKYLGRISYGLYMFHALVILVVMKLLLRWNLYHDYWLYPLAVLGTIGIATLSYEYFEKQFLKLKKRFVIVDSGAKL